MRFGHSHTRIMTRQRVKAAVISVVQCRAERLRLYVFSSAFLLSLLLLLGAGRLIGP